VKPVGFLIRIMWGLVLACLAVVAGAHPLGNNTVNRQARLSFSGDRASIDYRLDLAELRTLAAAEAADRDGDGTTSDAEWLAWRQRLGADLSRTLELRVDGRRLALQMERSTLRLLPGEAGLSILRADTRLSARLPLAPASGEASRRLAVDFADHYRESDAGWREIFVTAGDSIRIDGAVASHDRSAGLMRFSDQEQLAEASAHFGLTLPKPVPASLDRSALEPSRQPPESVATLPPAIAENPGVAPTMSMGDPADFFLLGMHHLATGWDHLVFLLGLLLLSRRLGEIVRVVTAFSVAHSVTFMASAAGWVTVPGALVEAPIALTIAYLGALALTRRASGHGIGLAFLFGLVHGLGFAGALAESLGPIETGTGWLWRLAAFNLGIEVVQLALVFLALAVFRVLRGVCWLKTAHAVASASVLASGLIWFFSRLSIV
jgi:hypothetical protein